jgi:hypothetical protein
MSVESDEPISAMASPAFAASDTPVKTSTAAKLAIPVYLVPQSFHGR